MLDVILAANQYLGLIIVAALLGGFGLLVLIIILVKRKIPSLQIKKEEISEEEAVQQELDRILVPIEDESIQEEMNKAADEEK